MEETKNIISPVNTADFQTAEHRYRRFDCLLPAGVTKDDLENPKLWAFVARNLNQLDEIRVIASDHSFVAYLMVTHVKGTDVRVKLMHGYTLEDVEQSEGDEHPDYEVKFRGPRKYSIIKRETGEVVFEDIPTKGEAQQQLDDHVKALAA